jgi:hypothetical protein
MMTNTKESLLGKKVACRPYGMDDEFVCRGRVVEEGDDWVGVNVNRGGMLGGSKYMQFPLHEVTVESKF